MNRHGEHYSKGYDRTEAVKEESVTEKEIWEDYGRFPEMQKCRVRARQRKISTKDVWAMVSRGGVSRQDIRLL